MDDVQLRSLRRQVRRDSDISNGAARLFAEIVDLHMMEEGCFAHDPTLAEWLGTTARTIRRWRKELYEAGYLREELAENGRHLTPQEAEPDKNVRTEMSGRTKFSGQNCPDRTEMSADHPDKNVRDREIYIPQAGGPGGESAPARGDGEATGSSPSLDLEEYDLELKDHPAVEAHQEFFPAVTLRQMQREKIATTVDDLDLWRQVLEEWALNNHRGRSIGRQIQKYHEDQRDANRPDDDRDRDANADRGGSQRDGDRGAPAGRGGQWGDYA